jgi:hypothetical protein
MTMVYRVAIVILVILAIIWLLRELGWVVV